jgi:anti-sigma B factor antagonist
VALALANRFLDGVVVVSCAGRIVEGGETTALQKHVTDLAAENPHVVLDLGGVEFVDSSGIGLLVRLLTRMRNTGGNLAICAASPRIREVLSVTRLYGILTPHESDTDAIADVFRYRAGPLGSAARAAILCVDGSPDVLAYLRELLQSAGYSVASAGNLPDALTLLIATEPKAIVISRDLRSSRGTRAAHAFNGRADALAVIELPPDFSTDDAGHAGARLLAEVQRSIGSATPAAPK